MEDITITSAIDFKTYLNISFRTAYKPRTFIFLIIICACMEISFFAKSTFNWSDQLYVLGYVVLFYGIIMPALIYFSCKRNMKKIAALNETLTYTINQDAIALKGDTISSSSNWKYVSRLIEREKYFLLKAGAKAFHYLPKDGFQSQEDVSKFKAIAKEKGIKFSYR